jgi:predicted dehydrogenase
MDRRYRVAIAGMGTMGRLYAALLAQHPRCELVGVADADPQVRETHAGRWSVPAASDAAGLLDAVRPDALCVALPDHRHRDALVAAAHAGVHVLVEKPLATTADDAAAMHAAAIRAGVRVMIPFVFRWVPAFAAVAGRVASGETGRVLTMTGRMDNRISQPLRRLAWSGDTSPAWFLMTHAVDYALAVMGGRITQVLATGSRHVLTGLGVPTEDYVRATLLFDDGRDATFDACWVVPDSLPVPAGTRFEVVAERETLYIDTYDQQAAAVGERFEHVRTVEAVLFGRQTGVHAAAMDTFVDLLDGRVAQGDVPGTREGLVNTQILVAVHRSLRSGRIEAVEEGP